MNTQLSRDLDKSQRLFFTTSLILATEPPAKIMIWSTTKRGSFQYKDAVLTAY